jgi:hypothetical protein
LGSLESLTRLKHLCELSPSSGHLKDVPERATFGEDGSGIKESLELAISNMLIIMEFLAFPPTKFEHRVSKFNVFDAYHLPASP